MSNQLLGLFAGDVRQVDRNQFYIVDIEKVEKVFKVIAVAVWYLPSNTAWSHSQIGISSLDLDCCI